MDASLVIPILIALLVIFVIAKGVRVVQQSETMVIERLGRYHKTLSAGFNILIPILDKPRPITYA